jgi:hypothetical protein
MKRKRRSGRSDIRKDLKRSRAENEDLRRRLKVQASRGGDPDLRALIRDTVADQIPNALTI